jgi:hypothetical protein
MQTIGFVTRAIIGLGLIASARSSSGSGDGAGGGMGGPGGSGGTGGPSAGGASGGTAVPGDRSYISTRMTVASSDGSSGGGVKPMSLNLGGTTALIRSFVRDPPAR